MTRHLFARLRLAPIVVLAAAQGPCTALEQ
jgi:hypothetical protein